jgi:protein TonB
LKRAFGASLVTLCVYAGLVIVLIIVIGWRAAVATQVVEKPEIVYLQAPGPSGGGGGGPKRPDPKPELPKEVKITPPTPIPVEAPPQLAVETASNLPAVGTASAPNWAGVGTGGGVGPGTGSGVGPGYGGGFGGGAYHPGSGIINPVLLLEKKPEYTADAMRAKLQGSVELEVVVLADGRVGDVRVIKSLDRTFGLDEKAIEAAKQWKFKPGTRQGVPVPIIVTIVMDFTLR